VEAIALNTAHLGEHDAQMALEETRTLTGLPCADPVRHGGEALLEALLAGPLTGLAINER
jgi:uncharacterized NAD-dependent epimerase/dehydratase family protein